MKKITIGLGSCGISAGGNQVYQKAKELLKDNSYVSLETTGCIGMCYNEVLVEIEDENMDKVMYAKVTPEIMEKIYNEHIINGRPVQEHIIIDKIKNTESYFFEKQNRIALKNVGLLNPESFSDYEKREGFKAFEKALKLSQEEIIDMIKESGLRGRGGGGFPTGIKWELTKKEKAEKKYIICNADEGDPGAFMDRSLLEGNPYLVLEGMLVAAYAIGASQGYVYIRAEYPLAIKHLNMAIAKMRKHNLLGNNILDKNFSFDIQLKEGAGAFVCGEETALIASIEGKRGMPQKRPPFPAVKGVFSSPTNINNVETYANVPWIILNGAQKFSSLGTKNSKGTKVFALAGKIKKSGLVEVPMGITLREIIYDIGGGIKGDREFKSAQLGGPSGGCLTKDHLDVTIDYESLKEKGAIMGSGGMIIMDDTSCMVDVAKYFLTFIQKESCGKCPFCRVGTKRMLEILEKISSGKGKLSDIETLYELAENIKSSSLCGLGQTASNPVLTTLKYFKDEYIAHIVDKKCPAKVCTSLISYNINENKCVGCGLCAKVCPTKCISGKIKNPYFIDQNECIKCGNCFSTCKFKAIEIK